MNTVKVVVAVLQDVTLDWAVAKADGLRGENGWSALEIFRAARVSGSHRYSTDWAHAGPIIAENRISILARSINGESDWWASADPYDGDNEDDRIGYEASDPLTAAMRCFVASKLGDEVDIPAELVTAPAAA